MVLLYIRRYIRTYDVSRIGLLRLTELSDRLPYLRAATGAAIPKLQLRTRVDARSSSLLLVFPPLTPRLSSTRQQRPFQSPSFSVSPSLRPQAEPSDGVCSSLVSSSPSQPPAKKHETQFDSGGPLPGGGVRPGGGRLCPRLRLWSLCGATIGVNDLVSLSETLVRLGGSSVIMPKNG